MKYLYLFMLMLLFDTLYAQETSETNPWQAQASIGQYAAALGVPNFRPIHLGLHAGVKRQWNKSEKHTFQQSAQIGWVAHPQVQHAVQLYSELEYEVRFANGFRFSPVAMGGGYVLSFSDFTTLEWNATTSTYEEVKLPLRHNWMISIGASLGYATKWKMKERPLTFFADYRLQVQGIFVAQTSPVIAYAPVRIGLAFPL